MSQTSDDLIFAYGDGFIVVYYDNCPHSHPPTSTYSLGHTCQVLASVYFRAIGLLLAVIIICWRY